MTTKKPARNIVQLSDIEAEIKSLNARKACKSDSIPVKLLKENASVCIEPIMNIINGSITSTMFYQDLKYADLIPIHKRMMSMIRITTVPSVFYRLFPKYLKGFYKIK